MPQSESFELIQTVEDYGNVIKGLTEIDAVGDDDMPHVDTSDKRVAKKNETYAKLFRGEMETATKVQKGLHWKWSQIFFYYDYGRLWATEEAGAYDSFNGWLTDHLESLPFGRAQINKLKRVWLVYIHRMNCNTDKVLKPLLMAVGNIDKLSELASVISKGNVKEWLTWLVEENPTLEEVHAMGQETKRLLRINIPRNDITPNKIKFPVYTRAPIDTEPNNEFDEPEEIDEYEEPTGRPAPLLPAPRFEIRVTEPPVRERYKSLKEAGIGKSWYGRIPPETPVTVERIDYDDRTEIIIYKED